MTQDLAPQAVGAADEDDEISLLDLLQVVVDNLRLLVLGPLAAGLVALGEAPPMTDRQRAEQVLEAHRVLSAAHGPNVRKFAGVVKVLEQELAVKPGGA